MLLRLALLALAACAARPVYVPEPSATTPPGPGYSTAGRIQCGTTVRIGCAVGRRPLAPELHGSRWACPSELRQ